MSAEVKTKKITTNTLMKRKKDGQKITMLTAYDFSTAKYFDEAGIDTILVGDSLGMVVLGYESTHCVTMEEMKIFTSAVCRGAKNAFVVADMPFLSYQVSVEEALKNAGELIKAGASAVKLEGGDDFIVNVVSRMHDTGIPVVAHLGFTPQYLHVLGGYRIQGKSKEAAELILEQSKKLEKAGACALVLEMVPEEAAKYITENLSIPTIGIGAGRYTDGQVLVCDDILGKYSEMTPKFARKYADLKTEIFNAAKAYINDVTTGVFPEENEIFHLSDEEANKLESCCCK